MTCLRQLLNSTLSNVFAIKFVKKHKGLYKNKNINMNRTLDNVKCVYIYEYMCEYTYIRIYTQVKLCPN